MILTASKDRQEPRPFTRLLLRNDASGNSHQHRSPYLANASDDYSPVFFANFSASEARAIPCFVLESTLVLRRNISLLAQIYQRPAHHRLRLRTPLRPG